MVCVAFPHLVVLFIAAYLSRNQAPRNLTTVVRQREPEVGRSLLAFGLFDEKEVFGDECCSCGDDIGLCLCSLCCLPIAWADTMSNDRMQLIPNFWIALCVACLEIVEFYWLTFGLSRILFVGVAVYYRQQLRRAYGLRSSTCPTCCLDCCVWLFFPPCAAVQEARQVRFVNRSPSSSALVGAPVTSVAESGETTNLMASS